LQARSYGQGRGFVLRLPGGETSVLSLEIPKEWVTTSRRGIRRGPLAATGASHSVWEIDAELGQIDVQIFDPGGSGRSAIGATAWLKSATEIDLRRSKAWAQGPANWTSTWQLERDPRNPQALEIELDPALDLLDVVGPKVSGYRVRKKGATRWLEAALEGDVNPVSTVQILARVDVPSEGSWTIPWVRPGNAIWMGGTTTVLLDDDAPLKEWREISGRRVFPAQRAVAGNRRLVFESDSCEPAAELVFARPRAESSCEIRGQLFLGTAPSRLECQLKWKVQRGLLSELAIDLSAGWVPDQVRFRELSEATTWHSSRLNSGVTRIQAALPSSALARAELTLDLSASLTVSPGQGPLELPRVRPVLARVADDVWLAWVDADTMIQPTAAQGVAWIDPKDVAGLGSSSISGSANEFRQALAWRWLSESASARIDRGRIGQEPGVSITTDARIDPGGQRLTVEGRIVIDSGAELIDTLPVWINLPGDALKSWRFRALTDGRELDAQPLDKTASVRLGFPAGGSTRGIAVGIRPDTGKTVLFHAELPWRGQGPLPLLSAPSRYLSRGIVRVAVPAWFRSRVVPDGLRRLDSAVMARSIGTEKSDVALATPGREELPPAKGSNVHWFTYTGPGSQLELATEELTRVPLEGVVQEALLTTIASPHGASLNRLRLVVQSGEARFLAVTPPAGFSLVHLRRDGLDVALSQSQKARLLIPLENAGAGTRSSTIVLDYQIERSALADGSRVSPVLPQVDMPCLAFVWEIVTPRGWQPADWTADLAADEFRDHFHWPFAALEIWRGWSVSSWLPTSPRESDLYAELDARLAGAASDTVSFAEWFTRWDSGPRPVVVDRLSLDLAGLGPRSRSVLGRPATNDRQDVSRTMLKRNRLAILPTRDALVITTDDEGRKLEETIYWSGAIAEALFWGSDSTDRFQTLTRWRGEPSPRIAPAGGDPYADRARLVPGWSTWRFSSADWPSPNASTYLIDRQTRAVRGWFIAGLFAGAYVLGRGRLGRWRALFLIGVLAASVGSVALVPGRYTSYLAAGVVAGLAGLVLELAGGTGTTSRARWAIRRSAVEALPGRFAGSTAGMLTVVFLLLTHSLLPASASSKRDSTILALFPYELPFDPAKPPKLAILRLADLNRLEQLASDVSDRARVPSGARAVSALHRVSRRDGRSILVESEYELMSPDGSLCAWEFPVSSTRDIEVNVDGAPRAIAITPNGTTGAVILPSSGRHVVRLRRSASARTEAADEVMRVPVVATPSARVKVEPSRDGASSGRLNAFGRSELRPDGSLSGLLGPVDRIEIHWNRPGSPPATAKPDSVEGLILWDIHPAGDRVRARFRVQQVRDGSTLRIGHDPKLILRSVTVPGLADGFAVENPAGDVWTLHADPPIEPGSEVSLDCWMPLAAERGGRDIAPLPGSAVRGRLRRLPRLQPFGAERYLGVLGVRRPGDWTGRLDPLPAPEPIGDEAFVKAWGKLADEPLTLCGTSRLVPDSSPTLLTGPAPGRAQIKPSVTLKIESGRVAVNIEAEISEFAGHLFQLEMALPEDLVLVEVTGEELALWKVVAPGRLRLMFDRPAAHPPRLVRIEGWVPLNEDPLKVGVRSHRLSTPWIHGEGIEFVTGFLTISSTAPAALQGASGVTPISSESSPAVGSMPGRHRYSYQVDDQERLGAVVWESVPPRVSVAIESQTIVFPESVEWMAVLRYDVIGGALDSIHLRMPAAWAAAADVRLTGGDYQLTKETRGPSAFWTITPARPIWGAERFIVHSALPLSADRAVVHPEIAPLGRGAVDAYLRVVNATSQTLLTEDSTGLQSISSGSKFKANEFAAAFGAPVAAFRVLREPWVWQLQRARAAPEADNQDGARLSFADLQVSNWLDSSTTGRATYDTLEGSGRALCFELPPSSTLLWAVVDSNPATPFLASSGKWWLLLDSPRSARVSLIWRAPPVSLEPKGSRLALELPRAGTGPTSALLSVNLAQERVIEVGTSGLEPATTARYELARAEQIGRGISDLVARMDRFSSRDHEKLVSLVIDHEMALRDAERSFTGRERSAEQTGAVRAHRDFELAQAARYDRFETLRRAGLDDDIASAQAYLGYARDRARIPKFGAPEALASDRLRSFGERTMLVGAVAGIEGPRQRNRLAIATRTPERFWIAPRLATVVMLLVLATIAIVLTALARRAWIDGLALVSVAGIAGYWGGPLALLGALGLCACGWRMRHQ
jgi:hypothetical protein